MNTSSRTRNRTRMFARVLGPFFTIVAIIVAVRAPDMRSLLSEFTQSGVWPWVMGAFALMGGIAIIAFHQFWRGAAAVIISALGWILAARGILLLAFPDTFASLANRMIGAVGAWQTAYIIFGLVGLYLTYVGWWPAHGEPQGDEIQITIDHPHAA